MYRTHRTIKHFFTVVGFFFLFACDKPLEQPELHDPIYKAIEKELQESQSELDSLTDEAVTIQKEIDAAKPRSLEKKLAAKKLVKVVARARSFEQKLRFLKIRLQRRRVEGRILYLEAFKKGESWPKDSEVSAYQANKRLISAPQNWNKRVPKLQDRLPTSLIPEKPATDAH